jgi:hypothetical protein
MLHLYLQNVVATAAIVVYVYDVTCPYRAIACATALDPSVLQCFVQSLPSVYDQCAVLARASSDACFFQCYVLPIQRLMLHDICCCAGSNLPCLHEWPDIFDLCCCVESSFVCGDESVVHNCDVAELEDASNSCLYLSHEPDALIGSGLPIVHRCQYVLESLHVLSNQIFASVVLVQLCHVKLMHLLLLADASI